MVKKEFEVKDSGVEEKTGGRWNLELQFLITLSKWLDDADTAALNSDIDLFYRNVERATKYFCSVLHETEEDVKMAAAFSKRLDIAREMLNKAGHGGGREKTSAFSKIHSFLTEHVLLIRQVMDRKGMLRDKTPVGRDAFESMRRRM